MACDNCLDAWSEENIEPPCFQDIRRGEIDCAQEEEDPGVNCCWIPDVTDEERRVLELRNRLVGLSELHIGGEILKMYDADRDDIELIAVIEEELRVIEQEKKGNQ